VVRGLFAEPTSTITLAASVSARSMTLRCALWKGSKRPMKTA
jgi:hypothetical protein